MKSNVVIKADGSSGGTRVETADGRDITRLIKAVSWAHAAGALPEVSLDLMMTPSDLTGVLHRVRDGRGVEIKRIIFADGTELSTED